MTLQSLITQFEFNSSTPVLPDFDSLSARCSEQTQNPPEEVEDCCPYLGVSRGVIRQQHTFELMLKRILNEAEVAACPLSDGWSMFLSKALINLTVDVTPFRILPEVS
jgi:hypothetical protein